MKKFGPVMASAPEKTVKEMSKDEYGEYKKKYDREMSEIIIGYKRVKEK